jgi:phosphonate transport system substrate-binding protein
VLGVANKDYKAASIANSVMKRMIARGVIKAEQVKSIYRSQTFPTTAYGYVYNLRADLAAKINEAFISFPWAGSGLLEQFRNSDPPQQKFIPIDYAKTWEVVRQVDRALGVEYTCK